MNQSPHSENDELFPIGRVDPLMDYLRDIWRRRDFIIQVPLNELRVQNANTFLGNIWLVLNPALSVGVYFIVFGLIVDVRRGVEDYLAFLTIGVFVFSSSQRVIVNGAGAVARNLGLIRTMRFPRAILPLGTAVSGVISFGPVLLVTLAVTIGYGNFPTWRWAALLPVFALQVLFNLGGSFFMARLNHVYTDLEYTLPYLFRLLFYLSGVLYSVDRFVQDESLRFFFALNPMYCFLSIWRWALLDLPLRAEVVGGALISGLVAPVAGFLFFRAGEATYGRAD